ncbi:import receptor subunit TOM70 [Seminavis robusta]|uniref:Import receptor subunit TOM70 n=1 Tax=Seminavis robusta TaxID=568900 RepID=A0A9N8EDE2_9STRA|nr:import receptor subunit TOM70 [Seminavis robusta]|eukprot:Sro785_g202130.1 import receptor subunit TOM70 (627) ;mRNA; r:21777-23966
MAPSSQQNQTVYVGVALAATAVIIGYLVTRNRTVETPKPPPKGRAGSPERTKKDILETATPVVSNTSSTKKSPQNDKEIQAQIEELDKQGKKLFKEKKFFDAAQKFTEALDIIDSRGSGVKDASSPLFRQMQTLMNNRSAMYEKGGFKELALDDCDNILALEKQHTKARTRKLRILESQENIASALVEACAIQLLFMQEHRDKLRFGIPTPPPPLSQSKLEELLMKLVPDEVENKLKEIKTAPISSRQLPSNYTILQLLKSYSGYNSWMAKVASRGGLSQLRAELPEVDDSATDETKAKRASLLLKIGQRQVYEGNYKESMSSFEEAFRLAETNPEVQKVLPDDDYSRILEWTGMVRHWIYDLDGAKKCFSMCADLEPLNAQILVKQACVEMDGANFDKALVLFESALKIDPGAADALLHRANLRMLKQEPEEAKADLNKCIELRPDHVLARLRLASILTAMNDVSGAKQHLESAKKLDPKSSEVQSYIGEIAFTKGELEDAQASFKLAMELAPNNPTPYVNAALTILNIPPPPGERPDTDEVIRLLEKAIEQDPMFHAAYVQLGQLKLGTAVTLDSAREVVELYDRGLTYCRTAEELKDLCSMRILTVSQVEAASQLNMDTFNVQ